MDLYNTKDKRKGSFLVVTKLDNETMRNKIIVFGFGKFGMYLFLLILLASCKKLNKIQVVGKVVNPITGEGIEGVKMSVITTTGGLPAGETTITSTITDANGNYALDGKKMKAVYLQINTFGNYHPIGWYVNGSYSGGNMFPVEKGKTMHVDFHAVPYGELQINIKNQNCFDSNDELKIFRTHSILNFYDNVPNPAVYSGCIDQVGNMNPAPMGWYKYSGTVTKNGSISLIKDSIFLNEAESKVWEILY